VASLRGQCIWPVEAPETGGSTPRHELTQMIREMAGQQVRHEVTGRGEGGPRGCKRVHGRER